MLYWLFFIFSICFLSFFPEIQIPSTNSKSRTVLPAVLLIQSIFCFIQCVCFMCICFYAFPAFHCFQSGSPMKIIERISSAQLNGLVTNTLRDPSANFMLWVQLFSIMLPRIEARISGDCGILYLLKL